MSRNDQVTRQFLQVANARELIGWILSFGRGVLVVRPAVLRERIRDEARRIAARA